MSAHKLTVLLVEDAALLRRAMSRGLESKGFDVVSFETAEEAWEAFDQRETAVVLSDWRLPGMDGLELAAKINATSEIPVIIISGHDSGAPRTPNVVSWLRKPVSLNIVAETITKAVTSQGESVETYPGLSRRLDMRYREALAPYLAETESTHDAIIATTDEGGIVYLNGAYGRFAGENGAAADFETRWGLGSNVFDAIPSELRDFFRAGYAKASPEAPWTHRYLCPSPDTSRDMTLSVRQIDGGLTLSTYRLDAAVPHSGLVLDSDPDSYRTDRGLIVQCANCRRIELPNGQDRWVLVRELVGSSALETSHGLCSDCLPAYDL